MSPIPPNIVMTSRKNLDALRTVNRDLAKRLDGFDWPDGVKFVPALDGTLSAFGEGLSKSGWFAYSGSPRIREQIVCEQFNAGESNVILPGCGQGYGLTMLLSKFDHRQSIFVWEPKLIHVAIVLGLWDLSKAISDRRLIFLTQAELEKSLVDFISAHQEFSVPTKMLVWPWLEDGECGQLSLAVERALAVLNPVVNRTVEVLQAELDETLEKQAAGNERLVQVFGLLVNRVSDRLARDLAWGVKKTGYRSDIFLIDQPGHNGMVGMLRKMIQVRPDTIISIGANKKNWKIAIPSHIRFVSFLSVPGVLLGQKVLDELPEPEINERFVVGDYVECEVLRKRFGKDNVFAIESAMNPEVFHPLAESHEYDVIISANRTDTDPAAWGISQESHRKLWKQIAKIIEDEPLRYFVCDAGRIIDQASQICGVRLSDPQLIESLEHLVKTVLIPSCSATAIALQMIKAGFKIRVVGSGWEKVEALSSSVQTMPEDTDELNELLHRGDLVLSLDSVTNRRQIVFDSLCAGRVVMVRRLPEDRLADLPEIDKYVVYLEADDELTKQTRAAMKKLPILREQMRQGRAELVEKYSFERQIRDILK